MYIAYPPLTHSPFLFLSRLAHAKPPCSTLHAATEHQAIARLKDMQWTGNTGIRHGAHKHWQVQALARSNSRAAQGFSIGTRFFLGVSRWEEVFQNPCQSYVLVLRKLRSITFTFARTMIILWRLTTPLLLQYWLKACNREQ